MEEKKKEKEEAISREKITSKGEICALKEGDSQQPSEEMAIVATKIDKEKGFLFVSIESVKRTKVSLSDFTKCIEGVLYKKSTFKFDPDEGKRAEDTIIQIDTDDGVAQVVVKVPLALKDKAQIGKVKDSIIKEVKLLTQQPNAWEVVNHVFESFSPNDPGGVRAALNKYLS